ncbi:helix-turn-helix domain-containing protein [Longispora albida]|uniref:helix-turn-helix domain-containing protein n=1 Tax=Longispora albida TaxID=203523 RepID=UPI00036FBDD6|nr:helix-turn-helix transcriptional regulator [Longispora albida]
MSSFGETVRRIMLERGVSQNRLAGLARFDKGYLSKVINGRKVPTEAVARACDAALGADGEIIAAMHLDTAAAREARPWQTADLIEQVHASEISVRTLEQVETAVFELCCEYPHAEAAELRREAHRWLGRLAEALRRPLGLRQRQVLLTHAGQLALLASCLEYDLGLRVAAEATRTAARQLAHESGNGELLAWAHEMGAWFALTQGRYADVLAEAEAGVLAGLNSSVAVQLLAQRAKALARMGDTTAVRSTLEEGAQRLGALPPPARPEHHFHVDPGKWDFYAMDAYRLAGDDTRASRHATEVLRTSAGPGGVERSPMRAAEARLTLGVVAARAGDLERAVHHGVAALEGERRSLPSLVMVASELESVLHARYPGEQSTQDFSTRLREVVRA